MSGAGDAGIEKQKALDPLERRPRRWTGSSKGTSSARSGSSARRAGRSSRCRSCRCMRRACAFPCSSGTRRRSGSRRRNALSPEEAAEAINAAPHVMLADLPTPLRSAGRDEVLVGPDPPRHDGAERARALDRERQPSQGRGAERRPDRRAPARAAPADPSDDRPTRAAQAGGGQHGQHARGDELPGPPAAGMVVGGHTADREPEAEEPGDERSAEREPGRPSSCRGSPPSRARGRSRRSESLGPDRRLRVRAAAPARRRPRRRTRASRSRRPEPRRSSDAQRASGRAQSPGFRTGCSSSGAGSSARAPAVARSRRPRRPDAASDRRRSVTSGIRSPPSLDALLMIADITAPAVPLLTRRRPG